MEMPHFCALGIKFAMRAAKSRQSLIHVQPLSMLLVCHVHMTWQLAAILDAAQHLLCIIFVCMSAYVALRKPHM